MRSAHALHFRAPGDDWYAGSADRYEITIRLRGGGSDSKTLQPLSAGREETISLPKDARSVRVVAFDEARNRSPALHLRVAGRRHRN